MATQTHVLQVPDDLDFAALKLARDADGSVSFEWGPIERLCAVNGLDIEIFRDGPEDNISGLVVAWYLAHLEQGGAPDPVQDDLIAEAMAEDEFGGGFSYPPGTA
jgi:hypothetical protein